jgi:4-carboxymuconolactone decarboxylase
MFMARLEEFRPLEFARERSLAMYSAAITLADEEAMARAGNLACSNGVTPEMLYEIVLQSYLFLGFPRMLTAAENLNGLFPPGHDHPAVAQISSAEPQKWFEDGLTLCRRVYADKYDSLMNRIEAMAPEVFQWMIIEGYGKVLSRPALDIVSREISIVAFLMMENRRKQLRSHIIGALNTGAPMEMIRLVVDDIGPAAGQGYESSRAIINWAGT